MATVNRLVSNLLDSKLLKLKLLKEIRQRPPASQHSWKSQRLRYAHPSVCRVAQFANAKKADRPSGGSLLRNSYGSIF